MTRRRRSLDSLWQGYLAQPSKISPETMAYVAALKARIDALELDLALARGEVRRLNAEFNLVPKGAGGIT